MPHFSGEKERCALRCEVAEPTITVFFTGLAKAFKRLL
jgi:hypothetical protein